MVWVHQSSSEQCKCDVSAAATSTGTCRERKIDSVGRVQLTARCTGCIQDDFCLYSGEETRANVLSFAQVEDITYIPRKRFTVRKAEDAASYVWPTLQSII
jgi:hypothetical protein